MAFADDFAFTRSTTAPFVDAGGATRIAAVDQPRFDYDAQGRPLGLLVAAGAAGSRGDRVRVVPGDWAALSAATVLHEWQPVGAAIVAEAHYAVDPAAMIDGCLCAAGHHRRILVLPDYMKNYGGWVWALGQRWTLPSLIGVGGGGALAAKAGRPALAT